VDDEPVQLKLCKIQLEAAGYAVETATSAHEALERVKVAPPDAIVSDVLLSGVDGFGLCRKVREDASLAAVPVILLSAHCDGYGDVELSARVGAEQLVARTPDFSAELAVIGCTL